MSERYKNVVCVDLLLKRKEKEHTYILLMKRHNTGYEDRKYELPGGHLEQNEDLYDAMIRETKEELLIDLNRNDLSIIQLFHHYTGERINVIFEADGTNLEPKIGEPEKCEELLWCDINELPSEISEKMKIIIENIKNNKPYDKL